MSKNVLQLCPKKACKKQTGCVGCPFNQEIETDLVAIKTFEPKLYKAIMNVFGQSYEYTRKYREFYKEMKEKENLRGDS